MINRRRFQYGVFDRDGVLIDSYAAYSQLFQKVAEGLDLKPLARPDAIRSVAGTNWHDSLAPLLPLKQRPLIDELMRRFDEGSQDITESAGLFPQVAEVLKSLKEQGMLLFVSSSAFQDHVDRTLEKFGIKDFFDGALGFQATSFTGKDAHLKIMAEKIGLPLEDFAASAFFLGDMEKDMAVSKRNGLYAIGITTTEPRSLLELAGADQVIDEHRELLNFE